MGVTVALAWRLPDQPNFREKTEPVENHKTIQIDRKHGNASEAKIIEHNRPSFVYHDVKNYHDHRISSEHQNDLIEKSKKTPTASDWSKARWYALGDQHKTKFRHRIYPVLLKRRSIPSQKSNGGRVDRHLERHTQHHRQTRFSLYQAVEKYLNA